MQHERKAILFNLKRGSGAIDKNFDPRGLVAKMCSKYFTNSANKLSDKDIEKLISCPKVRVDNFKGGGKLLNLSMEFNRANKNSKVYFSSNIEYYASVVDGEVQLFAVTYTKRQGVNSVSLSYLPKGKVDDAIFLARVCQHPSEHRNKMSSTIVPCGKVHFHKASEGFYRLIEEREAGKPLATLAKHFADPDAEMLPTQESVNVIAKRMFDLRSRTINVYKGKDMIDYMKKNIREEIGREKK